MYREQSGERKDVKKQSPEGRALEWLLTRSGPLRVDPIRNLLTDVSDDEASAELEKFAMGHLEKTVSGNLMPVFADLVVLVEAGVAMGPKSWGVVRRFHEQMLGKIAGRQYDPGFLKMELRELEESFAAVEESLSHDTDKMPKPVSEVQEGRDKLRLFLHEASPRLPQIELAIAALPDDVAVAELESFANEVVQGANSRINGSKATALYTSLMDTKIALHPRVRATVERLRARLDVFEYGSRDRLVAELEQYPMPLHEVLQRLKGLPVEQAGEAFRVFTEKTFDRMRKGNEAAYGRAQAALDALIWQGAQFAPEVMTHIRHAYKRLTTEKQLADEIQESRRKKAEFEALPLEERQCRQLAAMLGEDPLPINRVQKLLELMDDDLVTKEVDAWHAQAMKLAYASTPEQRRKLFDDVRSFSIIAEDLPRSAWKMVNLVAGKLREDTRSIIGRDEMYEYEAAMLSFDAAKARDQARRDLAAQLHKKPFVLRDAVQAIGAMPHTSLSVVFDEFVTQSVEALRRDDAAAIVHAIAVFDALSMPEVAIASEVQDQAAYYRTTLINEKRVHEERKQAHEQRNRKVLRGLLDAGEKIDSGEMFDLFKSLSEPAAMQVFDAYVDEAIAAAKLPTDCAPIMQVLGYAHSALPLKVYDLRDHVEALQERVIAQAKELVEASKPKPEAREQPPKLERPSPVVRNLREGWFATALPMLVRDFGDRWYENGGLMDAAKEGIAKLLDDRVLQVDKVEAFARQCGFTGEELDTVIRVPKRKAPKKRSQV